MSEDLNRRALRAGLWYTVCNVLVKGISFITVPIFIRLLTPSEYGEWSNYISWLSLLMILVTLEPSTSIGRAKFDFPDELDAYISAIQFFGTLFTVGCFVVVICFNKFFSSFFSIDLPYIVIMFCYLMVYPALTLLQAKHRILMRYKEVSILTLGTSLSTVICSLVLIKYLDDGYLARVLGNSLPMFCVCLSIWVWNTLKGRSLVNRDYWRYMILISVPLVPHLLANNILGTSDQLVIRQYWGAEAVSTYAVTYSCSQIVTLLGNSINQAWSPWLYEQLSVQEFDQIRHATNAYVSIAALPMVLLSLLGPEVVAVIGGEAYTESSSILPPVMAGCFLWVLYTFFVNIEFYEKKTIGITMRSLIGAAANLSLNLLLVPRFGYQAAAWTTLIGYALLFVMHAQAGISLGAKDYYTLRTFALAGAAAILSAVLIPLIYRIPVLRLTLVSLLIVVIILIVYKNRILVHSLINQLVGYQ